MLQVADCYHSLSSSFSFLSGSVGLKIFFFPFFCVVGGGFFFPSSCVGGGSSVKMALTVPAAVSCAFLS
jgi:hypothetical protein